MASSKKTQQNEWRNDMEPIRKNCAPWKELNRDSNIKWEPGLADKYTGILGDPLAVL